MRLQTSRRCVRACVCAGAGRVGPVGGWALIYGNVDVSMKGGAEEMGSRASVVHVGWHGHATRGKELEKGLDEHFE